MLSLALVLCGAEDLYLHRFRLRRWASGPMTATFLLPFAMGACDALGGNVVTDAFGVVAMVAMTPLVTIQLLGVSYQRKLSKRTPVPAVGQVEEIIELA